MDVIVGIVVVQYGEKCLRKGGYHEGTSAFQRKDIACSLRLCFCVHACSCGVILRYSGDDPTDAGIVIVVEILQNAVENNSRCCTVASVES
jgi:hypothetical protein